MDKNSHPFSTLTAVDFDAILARARDERAKAAAALLAGFRRWIGAVLKRPLTWAHAAQSRTRALLTH